MDLKWEDARSAMFASSVGLITSKGKDGDNIMSAEWTHHVSYEPAIFMVAIGKEKKKTAENIKKSKVFGLHLASESQNMLANIAGNNSGNEINKIGVLKELGFKFEKAKKIDVLMVKDTAFAVECKLKKIIDIGGDHEIFVGEVVYAYPLSDNIPLIYNQRKFWKRGEQLHRPEQAVLDKIDSLIEKYKR